MAKQTKSKTARSRAAASPSKPLTDQAQAEAAQRAFFRELLKRERAAVQAFADFLAKMAHSVRLDETGEAARLAAVQAAADLDGVLASAEQMMGSAHAV